MCKLYHNIVVSLQHHDDITLDNVLTLQLLYVLIAVTTNIMPHKLPHIAYTLHHYT